MTQNVAKIANSSSVRRWIFWLRIKSTEKKKFKPTNQKLTVKLIAYISLTAFILIKSKFKNRKNNNDIIKASKNILNKIRNQYIMILS